MGEILICRLYKKTSNVKFNVSYRFRIVSISKNIVKLENVKSRQQYLTEIAIGSASNARMGIGANHVLGFHLTVGGTSQVGWFRTNQNLTVVGNYWVNTNGRIFERADAFNSLNVVSTSQINFSLQSDRATDPTTGTIALQLDDTNGITINRAVVNNQTLIVLVI